MDVTAGVGSFYDHKLVTSINSMLELLSLLDLQRHVDPERS